MEPQFYPLDASMLLHCNCRSFLFYNKHNTCQRLSGRRRMWLAQMIQCLFCSPAKWGPANGEVAGVILRLNRPETHWCATEKLVKAGNGDTGVMTGHLELRRGIIYVHTAPTSHDLDTLDADTLSYGLEFFGVKIMAWILTGCLYGVHCRRWLL